MVRVPDCHVEDWSLKGNLWVIVWKYTNCPPRNRWVSGGNIWEVKCGKEKNWSSYLISSDVLMK